MMLSIFHEVFRHNTEGQPFDIKRVLAILFVFLAGIAADVLLQRKHFRNVPAGAANPPAAQPAASNNGAGASPPS